MRRWARFIGLLLGMIVCVPLHYAWKLAGAKSPWPRRFLFWVGYVAGVRLDVRGEYRRTNILFVANHATWLDIMIIGGTTGAAFVAKEELKTSKFVHLDGQPQRQHLDPALRPQRHSRARSTSSARCSNRAAPSASSRGHDQGRQGRPAVPRQPVLRPSTRRSRAWSSARSPIDYGEKKPLGAWGDEAAGAGPKRAPLAQGTIPTASAFRRAARPGAMDRKQMATCPRQLVVDALAASDAPDPRLYPGAMSRPSPRPFTSNPTAAR
jgi:1-acyl-sn-glycerol-3-phosphate acyltransferase